MVKKILVLGVFAAASSLVGCGTTVRYLTPIDWSNGPDGAQATAAAPPSVAPAAPAPGADPAAPVAVAVAVAPPAAGDPDRILYLTYWEGSCSGGFAGMGKGCNKGDTKVKRCNVKPDNTMMCSEEAEANKAFSTSN